MLVKRRYAALLLIALALAGCDAYKKVTATKIRDILDHPRDFENKDVTIYGTVTESSSVIFVKFFEVQDDTGRIKVVTNRVLPQNGEKVQVTGRMQSIEIGPQRTIVLRENPREGEPSANDKPR
jgi:aspartyl/asparaginyl-tRNA synthetase